MRIPPRRIIATLALAGFIAAPAFAQTTSNTNVTKKVYRTKQGLHKKTVVTTTKTTTTVEPVTHNVNSQELVKSLAESKDYLPFDLDVPGQSFVSTGPYVGVPIQFAGGNLIINSPSVNTDLQLLSIRKGVTTQLDALAGGVDVKEPYHSHLLFSGIVEGQAYYVNNSNPNNGGYPVTNIDLTNVTLDATVFGPGDWLLGFVELTYDNSSPANNGVFESTSHFTVANSRVFVNKAFVTIGNLICSPWYTTFGQYYVPFGVYSSVYVSDPVTKSLARTKARALTVGYAQQDQNAFYAAAYVFRGDSTVSANNRLNNGGLNLGYKWNNDNYSINVGGGVIANIADSVGMQMNANFQTNGNEILVHRVPAYDLHANFGIGQNIDFLAEYIRTTTEFSPLDLTYNGRAAQPSALDVEASYSFNIGDRPSAIGVGYSHTTQALALGLPTTRYTAVFNTSLFRNTTQSLEYRRDTEYPNSARATGPGQLQTQAQTGNADNAVTLQFDFYF